MNFYSVDEVRLIFVELNVGRINLRSNSVRGTCPIHSGADNPVGFAAWLDKSGIYRTTCHTRQCVTGSTLEWLFAKVNHCSVADATKKIAQLLQRPDLQVPDFEHHAADLRIEELPPICLYDNSAWERLVELYPYHEYWHTRGYSERITREYGLTFRTLDERAVIPVVLEHGTFVGVMERTFQPDMPKYIWQSPNSEKGRFLFGIPQALNRPLVVNGMRVVFVVEGTLDTIKAADEGFPVVATQTNRFSAAQALALIGNWDAVIIIPDKDEAGAKLPPDVHRHAGAFVETAVFHLPEAYKDLDSMPQGEIAPLLNNALLTWSEQWMTSRRFQRQQLMVVTAPI
jgi:hypothetical protein